MSFDKLRQLDPRVLIICSMYEVLEQKKKKNQWKTTLCFQYTEDPTFDRHGLTLVTVLEQATSGLAHLHSLNVGKD